MGRWWKGALIYATLASYYTDNWVNRARFPCNQQWLVGALFTYVRLAYIVHSVLVLDALQKWKGALIYATLAGYNTYNRTCFLCGQQWLASALLSNLCLAYIIHPILVLDAL